MTFKRLPSTSVGTYHRDSVTRGHRGAALCGCRHTLRFTTDHLGRTLEHCDGCGYRGAVRVRAGLPDPATKRLRAPRGQKNPRAFRCGHPKTPENSYMHRSRDRKSKWAQCRTCVLNRSRPTKNFEVANSETTYYRGRGGHRA